MRAYLTRWSAGAALVLACTLALLLTGCGGGECDGMTDRQCAQVLGIQDAENAFAQPCNGLLTGTMFGFWARVDECGIPRANLVAMDIPKSDR